jgi:hypothetical protein
VPIPESQLETWSHQGAIATARLTHESVRNALAAVSSPIRGMDYEVYLQGSYRNSTNIRSDSDVDVVVQLNSTFGYDLSGLPTDQARLFQAAYSTPAAYRREHFRPHVLTALQRYYGTNALTEGSKSLKLRPGPGRLGADIIPAIHFRKYTYFYGQNASGFIDGIQFDNVRDRRNVVNFPRLHYDNGVSKNSADRTNGRYKPAVRMFKNAASRLIDQGAIAKAGAPSYFIECLLYNVPDINFSGSLQDTFLSTLRWLWTLANLDCFMCQNGQLTLFGSTSEQWSDTKAAQFVKALADLWHNR